MFIPRSSRGMCATVLMGSPTVCVCSQALCHLYLDFILISDVFVGQGVTDFIDLHLVTFGDIWCRFVSFGPAPHIYQRGERVGEPVCTIHGHYPDYLVVGPAGQVEVPWNTRPTRAAYI